MLRQEEEFSLEDNYILRMEHLPKRASDHSTCKHSSQTDINP